MISTILSGWLGPTVIDPWVTDRMTCLVCWRMLQNLSFKRHFAVDETVSARYVLSQYAHKKAKNRTTSLQCSS